MKVKQNSVEIVLTITINDGRDFAALAQIMNDAQGVYVEADQEYTVASQFMNYLETEGWYKA